MKMNLFAAAPSLLSNGANVAVVYDQPHTATGVILQSSRYHPNGTDFDQHVWDSFMVTNSAIKRQQLFPAR